MVNIAAILLRLCHTRGRVVRALKPASLPDHPRDRFRRKRAAKNIHIALLLELASDRPVRHATVKQLITD